MKEIVIICVYENMIVTKIYMYMHVERNRMYIAHIICGKNYENISIMIVFISVYWKSSKTMFPTLV